MTFLTLHHFKNSIHVFIHSARTVLYTQYSMNYALFISSLSIFPRVAVWHHNVIKSY